jgi:hypothetical protein
MACRTSLECKPAGLVGSDHLSVQKGIVDAAAASA